MLYPVYVHMGDETHAYGATIPDFPGCFSASDNWEALPSMIQEAVELYCDGEDMSISTPSTLDDLMKNNDYQDQDGLWIMLDIDIV